MRVIIAGGRYFDNYQYVEEAMKMLNLNPTMIINGNATGADALGREWAVNHEVPIKLFTPEWNRYGRGAGPRRNRQMAEDGDVLVAFWDGKSKGTKNMIEEMEKKEKSIYIFYY